MFYKISSKILIVFTSGLPFKASSNTYEMESIEKISKKLITSVLKNLGSVF